MPALLAAMVCASLALAAPASAASSLTLEASDATVGGPIHATATLSGEPAAGGEISFEVYGPGDPLCLAPPLQPTPAAATVAGEGAYASGAFTPGAAGEYRWSAHYSGSGEDPPADATCAALSTVAKATPSLTLTATGATVGGAVHAEAVLEGSFFPAGEVTFSVYAPGQCLIPARISTVAVQSGRAVAPDFVTSEVGSYGWSASYGGDANNATASSPPCGTGSAVAPAAPSLTGLAASAPAGRPITDSVTLAGGFAAGGQLVFRAYGPDDRACAAAPAYEAAVAVDGDGAYSPPGFSPPPGLYRWTVDYGGDARNQARALPCGTENQSSAVGTVAVALSGSAASGVVGAALTATARIADGAVPGGRLTFAAFAPGDATCTGAAVATSTVAVAGNGTYRSGPLVPARAGAYRWKIAYGGDANHLPAALACGAVSSNVAVAAPTIAAYVKRRPTVGTPFRDVAVLTGAYAPGGKVTFRIYGPGNAGCDRPNFTDTVSVTGAAVSSDPFVAKRAGRYTFVAAYSGDDANAAAAEACGAPAQIALVGRRRLVVRPQATVDGRRISLGARVRAGIAPRGTVRFRLYAPGDLRCRRRPVFSGSISARANGGYTLAEYLASRPGIYRLTVAYSGDPRNLPVAASCAGAERLRVR